MSLWEKGVWTLVQALISPHVSRHVRHLAEKLKCPALLLNENLGLIQIKKACACDVKLKCQMNLTGITNCYTLMSHRNDNRNDCKVET